MNLLAFRNLFRDKVRLTLTLVGIVFAVVLITVQIGQRTGASRFGADRFDCEGHTRALAT